MALKLAMTAITGFGLLLSLCTQMLAAYLFGAGEAMDAYFAGVALPMFIVLLANEVASLYIVPALHRTVREQGRSALTHLQVRLLARSLLLWALVAAAGVAACASLVRILFPGLSPSTSASAAAVLAIQFVAVPFSTGACLLLHFRFLDRSYVLTYFVSLLTPLFVIGAAAAFHGELGSKALAVGSVTGAVAQFCALFVLARGWRLPLQRAFAGRPAWRSWSAAAWITCAVMPVHAASLIDRHFASPLGDGALSAIAYSWFFAMAAVSLVFRGWSMPVFHAISGDAVAETLRFRRRLLENTRELAVIASAMVIALQVAGPTAITLLLQRGAFATDDAALVEAVFRYHSVSVLGLVLYMLFIRACCAVGHARAAALIGTAGCALYAALAASLEGAGTLGLAQASLLSWILMGAAGIAYMTYSGWLTWRRALA